MINGDHSALLCLYRKVFFAGDAEDAHVILLCKVVKKNIKHEAKANEHNHCHDCQDV